jgi:hypothetical protein
MSEKRTIKLLRHGPIGRDKPDMLDAEGIDGQHRGRLIRCRFAINDAFLESSAITSPHLG